LDLKKDFINGMKVLFSYEGGAIFYEGGIEVEVDSEV